MAEDVGKLLDFMVIRYLIKVGANALSDQGLC